MHPLGLSEKSRVAGEIRVYRENMQISCINTWNQDANLQASCCVLTVLTTVFPMMGKEDNKSSTDTLQ